MSEHDELPRVTHSATVDVAGYLLTVHVLDNGQRVYEDTPELRRLLSDLGVRPTVPPQGEERGA